MTTPIVNPLGAEAMAFMAAVAFILLIATNAGKRLISLFLMKLYEIFIQETPAKI